MSGAEILAALMFIAANPPEAYPPTEEGLADGIKEAILAALDGGDGRHYRTCLATLMLESYYRFLPATGQKQ